MVHTDGPTGSFLSLKKSKPWFIPVRILLVAPHTGSCRTGWTLRACGPCSQHVIHFHFSINTPGSMSRVTCLPALLPVHRPHSSQQPKGLMPCPIPMYLYLFDFIPDHFLSVSRVCTGRNYLLTGDFGSNGCIRREKRGPLTTCGSSPSGIWMTWAPGEFYRGILDLGLVGLWWEGHVCKSGVLETPPLQLLEVPNSSGQLGPIISLYFTCWF